ncbi:site-specific integrase [Pedobacter frigidisoli]|uniref:Site-specific integrase n=1 Tax=Pedobacter frigidisoli TaxID=2530455 RepID=A0A4R0NJB0_9SPHI|nr:site-specific integrase [Pedobacter frigidisoli]TCD00782.1 site-specific integrase [Pedobacter frigidisoli]
MFTPPQISTNNDIKSRSFIFFYYNKKRLKFYNGNSINLPIFPNHAQTLKERSKLLLKLQQEYHKALLKDWSPIKLEEVQPARFLQDSFLSILEEKMSSPYSKFYKRDLKKVCEQFLSFIPKCFLNAEVSDIPLDIIEKFLNQFKTSGRTYMNKRRSLSIFFSEFVRKDWITKNPINKTSKQKIKAKLHEIYSEEQLPHVFQFLKINYYNLYLCCLMTYGCLLRPHQEIRQLKLKHISNDFSEILLSGAENKSGKIRRVHIPNYVKNELCKQTSAISDPEANIFTLNSKEVYNEDYFKTQWSRAKKQMLCTGLLQKNHTLYSFRHTAVVKLYRKTKDLHIVQQLLQHSNMIVTMNYLRGLGETSNSSLKDLVPELSLMNE